MTAEQGSSTTSRRARLFTFLVFNGLPRDLHDEAHRLIEAVMAEARQQALTDAIAAVRTEVPSITAINDVRFSDRMMSQGAVIDTLTRLREGSK